MFYFLPRLTGCWLLSSFQITSSDYVLFKLLEMQKVDSTTLFRVSARYHELDTSGEGALDIGLEVTEVVLHVICCAHDQLLHGVALLQVRLSVRCPKMAIAATK